MADNANGKAPRPIHPSRQKGGRLSLLPEAGKVDGRSRGALAFKEIVADILEDLGGVDHASRAQVEMAKRVAGFSVLAGALELKLIEQGTLIVGPHE